MGLGRRTLFRLALLAGLAGSGAAAGHAEGTIRVGAYPDNPPFETMAEDGSFKGFEIDIVNEAARRLGMKAECRDFGFQALFSAVAAKTIDVAIASITITPDRLRSVSFTQPYYDADIAIASRTSAPVRDAAELRGKAVAVMAGSTAEQWANDHAAGAGISDVKAYAFQMEANTALKEGKVAAVIGDVPGLDYSLARMEGVAVTARIKTGEQYGLMTGKDGSLLASLNDALTAMKKDGTLAAIHRKWFKSDAPHDSSTVAEAPLPRN